VSEKQQKEKKRGVQKREGKEECVKSERERVEILFFILVAPLQSLFRPLLLY